MSDVCASCIGSETYRYSCFETCLCAVYDTVENDFTVEILNIIGNFTFQPSEILKFAVIVLFAKMMADRGSRMRNFKEGFLPFLPILAAVGAVLMLQPHFSCTLLIMFMAATMMLVGGTRLWNFLVVVPPAAAAVFAYVSLSQKMSYAMARIEAWLHPFTTTGAGNYQTQQGLLAIGSGGLMGLGLGNSRQKHLYVPEPQNDFIFSIITEELGLIGAVLIIAAFVFFSVKGYGIALKARDRFSSFVAFGITTQIALQAALNIAVVTNTLPNTGISLPFFSQGGTSLVILLAEVGVVLNISRYCRRD